MAFFTVEEKTHTLLIKFTSFMPSRPFENVPLYPIVMQPPLLALSLDSVGGSG